MEVLSDKDLHCREFGSALFFVADFFKWLNEKHLRISTIPDIADYEFIQIESFLCAIERAASQVTTEEALEIVQIDPLLANDRMAETNPRWLVGAEAHRKWRIKIHEAVNAKELVPLDYGSKLPIAAPDATPAAKVEAQRSITKQAVVNAFESIHFTRDRWNRNLGDIKSAPWLEECRVSKGIKGDKSNPSRWNPVLIASELFSKQIKINSLDAVFQIKLKDWLDEWIEVSATFRN